MTGKEYCDALDSLGLNLESAARFLRMGAHTSRRIAAGDDRLGWARAALLRVMVLHHVTSKEVEQIMSDFEQESDE